MKALLISGEVRTFIFKEQMNFFKQFIKDYHIFIMLKITEYKGIENLKEIIQILKPKYSIAFNKWIKNETNNNDRYYSQISMIDHLINMSLRYEKEHNIKYECFVRIRPDLLLLEPINYKKLDLKSNYIYTSYKYDAIGNDQFFIINPYILQEWWIKMVRPTLQTTHLFDKCPDYVIFNKCRKFVRQFIKSGLVRDYERIDGWNNKHASLVPKNYWLNKNDYKSINKNEFISKLKEFIKYQHHIAYVLSRMY